jgi:hypothetical protein
VAAFNGCGGTPAGSRGSGVQDQMGKGRVRHGSIGARSRAGAEARSLARTRGREGRGCLWCASKGEERRGKKRGAAASDDTLFKWHHGKQRKGGWGAWSPPTAARPWRTRAAWRCPNRSASGASDTWVPANNERERERERRGTGRVGRPGGKGVGRAQRNRKFFDLFK